MSNIPLKCLLGAFAVVSITGCDSTADRDATDKGFCQKTDKGYEICIKEENISCNDGRNKSGWWSDCEAAGISIDLTGKEKHWTSRWHVYNGNYRDAALCNKHSINEDITCIAASHFGKINIAKVKSGDTQNPQDASTYNNRGAAKDDLGNYQGAIADYNKAIEINPQYAGAYYNRGNTKYELKDYQGAIADYTKAIEIDPQYASAYQNRGLARIMSKDYVGASADYTRAIQYTENPQDASLYVNRGIAKERRKYRDLKGACADWRIASSLGDHDAAGWVRDQCQ